MDLGNDHGFPPLTRTELSCLRRCADGQTDQEIGKDMELSPNEVASVISVVMLKLRTPNRMATLAKTCRISILANTTE